jgi:hypothetical protein
MARQVQTGAPRCVLERIALSQQNHGNGSAVLAAWKPGCLTAGMFSRCAWSLSIAALGSVASRAEAAARSESPGVERPSREVLVGGGISSMAAPRDSALELGPGLNVLFYYGVARMASCIARHPSSVRIAWTSMWSTLSSLRATQTKAASRRAPVGRTLTARRCRTDTAKSRASSRGSIA